MLTSNQKGATAETAIAHEAIKLGIEVYRPVAEGGRFDLIFAFEDASLARVQCKWAPIYRGTIDVRAYSCRRAPEGFRRTAYTTDEIDAIAAYCPDNQRCYYLPASMVVGHLAVQLRLTPTRNNQADGVNWAVDYEFGAIAQLGERRHGMAEAGGSSPPSSIARSVLRSCGLPP
jgi:PD-(D/E)XK endonuclease